MVTTGSLFVALYGAVGASAIMQPGATGDPYQLFYDRSLALGWLADSSTPEEFSEQPRKNYRASTWWMNDAGWKRPESDVRENLLSWFQVSVDTVAYNRSLPLQSFLNCAFAVTALRYFGEVMSYDVLLPVQIITANSRRGLAVPASQSFGWHASVPQTSQSAIQVRLNAGKKVLPATIARELRTIAPEIIGVSAVTNSSPSLMRPLFDSTFWNGPLGEDVVFELQISNWSPESVGWLLEAISDICYSLGFNGPMLASVSLIT